MTERNKSASNSDKRTKKRKSGDNTEANQGSERLKRYKAENQMPRVTLGDLFGDLFKKQQV